MQIVPPAYRYLPWALRFSGSERMDPWAPGRGDWACKLLVSERADEEARAESPLPWERRNGGRADSEDEDSEQTGVSESCAESPDDVGSSPFGGLSANRSQDDSPVIKKARKTTAAPTRRRPWAWRSRRARRSSRSTTRTSASRCGRRASCSSRATRHNVGWRRRYDDDLFFLLYFYDLPIF